MDIALSDQQIDNEYTKAVTQELYNVNILTNEYTKRIESENSGANTISPPIEYVYKQSD